MNEVHEANEANEVNEVSDQGEVNEVSDLGEVNEVSDLDEVSELSTLPFSRTPYCPTGGGTRPHTRIPLPPLPQIIRGRAY